MSRYLSLALCLALSSTALNAANKDDRLENCAVVLGTDAAIPESGRHLVDVLEKSAPFNESKRKASR